MAEAVALAASVVNFVQLADRVIGIAKFYIEALHDCPRDVRVMLVEIASLKAILENLSFLLETPSSLRPESLALLASDDGPVEMCRRSMADLEKLLPSDTPNLPATGRKRKRNLTVKHLAWPLRQSSANKLLEDISRYKTSISFALTCESINDIKDIKHSLGLVKETLTHAERAKVCDWLEVTNPSSNHNEAWRLHEDQTSGWVLRSPEWQAWLAGKEKFIWIHGIPGAGKTVLASFLIDEIQTYCDQQSSISTTQQPIASVYYYCYFARNQEEAAPFLRWLVSQLCRRAGTIPSGIHKLFNLSITPSISQLLEALEQIIREFETVFIIVDAIDEGLSRQDLLNVLRDLITDPRFDRVQLLATSREYFDIETSFTDISRHISMDNSLIAEDIRTYLHSALRTNPNFASWSRHLLEEVEDALNKGAKGMFRWAVCQIDVLRRLTTHKAIRLAIKNLPKTLDKTYERIFELIHDDDKRIVKYALLLICGKELTIVFPSKLRVEVLIEAISSSISQSDPGNETEVSFVSIDSLRDKCGCLIAFTSSKHPCVSLAHYTVQEYLYSNRITSSSASSFALSESMVREKFLRLVLEVNSRIPNLQKILEGMCSLEFLEDVTKMFKMLSPLQRFSLIASCRLIKLGASTKWLAHVDQSDLATLAIIECSPMPATMGMATMLVYAAILSVE